MEALEKHILFVDLHYAGFFPVFSVHVNIFFHIFQTPFISIKKYLEYFCNSIELETFFLCLSVNRAVVVGKLY